VAVHYSVSESFFDRLPWGVTPSANETEEDIVLKGVLRVENLDDPSMYIPEVFRRTKKEYLENTYGISDYVDINDFLEKYAQKSGKLLKKGEPDVIAVSKMILNDWVRGRIPYFVAPPEEPIFFQTDAKDGDSKNKNSEKTSEIMAPPQKISSIRVREEFKETEKSHNMDDDDVVSSNSEAEGDEQDEEDVEWEDVVESTREAKE